MKYKAEKSVISLIRERGGNLPRLARHSELLGSLQQQFITLLPPDTRQHYQLRNFHGQTLYIAADTAEWATNIRYASAEILAKIKQNLGLELTRLKCTVDPYLRQYTNDTPASAPLTISESTATLLKQTAAGIKNQRLQQVLERIAAKEHDE